MDIPKLLIVDDVPENISVLFEFLINQGFDVSIAPDGESALEVVKHDRPDLILLDVMMPGIDGFETCRRLKQNDASRPIPVIFMTALSDTIDKVKGFQLGAVDYVTKPVQQDEVLVRVKAHVTIRQLQKQLERQNAELRSISHTLANDLSKPLGIVRDAALLLEGEISKSGFPNISDSLLQIDNSTKHMQHIVEGLLTLSGLSEQSVRYEPLPMQSIIEQVIDQLRQRFPYGDYDLVTPYSWPVAYGHPGWVEEIWSIYLTNSITYAASPTKVELGATPQGEFVRYWVRDSGPGLSSAQQESLFIPFTELHSSSRGDQGLGLSVVERIISLLGGECGVESSPDSGSLFYFTLPQKAPEAFTSE